MTRDILTALNNMLESEAEGDEAGPLIHAGEVVERIRVMAWNAEQRRVEAQTGNAMAELTVLRERIEQGEG